MYLEKCILEKNNNVNVSKSWTIWAPDKDFYK